MAAPTQVRVESNSQISATLRWLYGGANVVGIYRSTDASIYTLIGSAVVGTVIYIDDTLSIGTRYYYKLSDDVGGSYSAVVNVTTQVCIPPSSQGDTLILPRFGAGSEETPVDPDALDTAMEEIEKVVTDQVTAPRTCEVCIENGSVVFDCSSGCSLFEVVVSEDINSISIVNCGDQEPSVNWVIPTNGPARGICGWPAGSGFGGDECTQAPIAPGRTMSTGPARPLSKPSVGPFEGTGGGGSGGCGCVPGQNNQLTIKSCNPNNSLKCSTTKSLRLLVCGGRGPYTWSKTGTVQLAGANGVKGTTASGDAITVTPPVNSGSAVAGVAYIAWLYECDSGGGVNCSGINHFYHYHYGCNDVNIGNTVWVTADGHSHGSGRVVTPAEMTCKLPGAGASSIPDCVGYPPTGGNIGGRLAVLVDERTGPMIAGGCVPCSLVVSGVTVSVTDSVGTTVTIVLTA